MLLFCTTSMFSEEFDERDLIGKWETIDSIGSFRSNPASISCPVENIDTLTYMISDVTRMTVAAW